MTTETSCTHTFASRMLVDGRPTCKRCATPGERRRIAAVDEAGPSIGLEPAECPEWHSRHSWPVVHLEQRERLLAWALKGGWARAVGHYCECWLLTGGDCSYTCYDYSRRWADHLTCWTRPGERLLVAQPYGVGDLRDLARMHAMPGMRVQIEPSGWYGFSTALVLITARADRARTHLPIGGECDLLGTEAGLQGQSVALAGLARWHELTTDQVRAQLAAGVDVLGLQGVVVGIGNDALVTVAPSTRQGYPPRDPQQAVRFAASLNRAAAEVSS